MFIEKIRVRKHNEFLERAKLEAKFHGHEVTTDFIREEDLDGIAADTGFTPEQNAMAEKAMLDIFNRKVAEAKRRG